ncbi:MULTISPECIES: DUF3618 domain-containing protein [Protofrankia]|uniref:DUF3618 domain-containing protein n=1 Tax=Candidatus Protofrankia datiscae TaxID=2716812 RepID=F8B145_9ACTN|nr:MULTISPECIES: DUF3618 domain-containing protein [Protofrankia]AEH08781.1 hypothetical protein FsymDg_1297 [Candidatus Protofrankia datiscae]
MPQDPAAIQQQIENTRAELAVTLDAIAELVSPRRVAERTGEQIRGRVAELRQKVITSGFGGLPAITADSSVAGNGYGTPADRRELAAGLDTGPVVQRVVRWDRVAAVGSGVLVLFVSVRRRRRRRARVL